MKDNRWKQMKNGGPLFERISGSVPKHAKRKREPEWGKSLYLLRHGEIFWTARIIIEDEGGFELAERFLASAQRSFETLSRMPKSGVLGNFAGRSASQLRRWPVVDFENWLIFYLPKRTGVEIVRVIHGARDLKEMLQ